MGAFFTNPLIVKEMRERFRSKKSIWILALYLLVMGALLFGYLYLEQMNSLSVPGEEREVFVVMAVVQYAMFCFVAPALSAGTISGERERQTLNILLTTQLSPFKIVTSKLVTSLAYIFLLVVASVPLYSLLFLYGGISPSQLLTMVVFFAVNILFFGSLGLFCSTWIRRTGVSTIIAYGLAFFFVVGTGIIVLFLAQLIEEISPPGVHPFDYLGMQILCSLNPVFVMFSILGVDPGDDLRLFMDPWLFFVIACCFLSAVLVIWSGYLLKPVRRSWLGWKKR
ncbi:MAG: ABC transporter permease subunit [Brevibacillus sp.]|nr:ABC transporter permease subunit [Brevibacillus sp.]